MLVPAIDIYVTYRCNLRCAHCFVGENLNLNSHFPFDSLATLITSCNQWGTKELTFLGGEPTLYPFIVKAIELSHSMGLKTRVITNGQQSFTKFIQTYEGAVRPQLGFSIDGATEGTHDVIRGVGTFGRLIKNIKRSRELGYGSHAIISVSRQNAHEVIDILTICDEFQLNYVNVHYVTSRGFAPSEIVLSVKEWKEICTRIKEHSKKLNVEIRLEETFIENESEYRGCAVRDRGSLLFFPDGRVFMCPMFIDIPDAHSFTWGKDGLVENISDKSEQSLCMRDTDRTCPAMRFVNHQAVKDAANNGFLIQCIFNKTRLVPIRH